MTKREAGVKLAVLKLFFISSGVLKTGFEPVCSFFSKIFLVFFIAHAVIPSAETRLTKKDISIQTPPISESGMITS